MNALSSFAIPNHVSFEDLTENYPVVKVSNSKATATIALHGAHIIDYTPAGQQPVIFTSKDAVYREGKAIRGGIPVCWPWFSGHPTDASLPAHGFARNAFWELFRAISNEDKTTLVFTFSYGYQFAELTVEIGESLSVSLKTTNVGDESVTIGGALHSYFTVSDINNISIKGLEGGDFHDLLTGTKGSEEQGIQISQEVDRIYLDSEHSVKILDPGFMREITIEKSGSKSTVVWNPWIEKSSTMADLDNQEYKSFVCVETANALEDVYQIAPGASHTLSTRITSVLK